MLDLYVTTAGLISQLALATPEHPVRLGRYEVTRLIGAGGMGTVYEATDLDHGMRVALKTLAKWDPESLLRFKNEFRSVADLSHPNLVSMYELNRHEDLWFFTMDVIDGVDFVEWLRGEPIVLPSIGQNTVAGSPEAARKARRNDATAAKQTPSMPPSMANVRDALAQLVSGVHALHQAGLLHLDIKPSNVLVDANGQVYVLDFGLIRGVDEQSLAPRAEGDGISISGTPMWMAPEQFTGGAIGKPADWYGVGLMLYFALTGEPAFPPIDEGDVAGRARADFVPVTERVPSAPEDLSQLTSALLQADASKRPAGPTLLELTLGNDTQAIRQQAGFVGREAELNVLRAAHADACSGRSRVVHIVGTSGLGKTALLRRFLDDVGVGDDGTTVLNGRCYERETVPYKAFDGLLDQLAKILVTGAVSPKLPTRLRELVKVFPVLEGVPQIASELEASPSAELVGVVERRRRAVSALCELFYSLAELRPLLLQIDDLQWADADSVGVLMQLLKGSAGSRLLVVLSFRPEEACSSLVVQPYLDGADEPPGPLVSIELSPLDDSDAHTLATRQLQMLNIAGVELASSIAAESRGVPFFVEELAHFATQHQDKSGAGSLSKGISLDQVLAERVKTLPEHQRTLVEVLSVANSPIPLHIAFKLSGLTDGALRSLWALRGRHLIRTTGAGANDLVELHHDRMRESVLDYLSEEQTRALHMGLARAFSAENAVCSDDTWLFDCVRHFNSVHELLEGDERVQIARLNLSAAQKARQSGAFPLAFDCFRAGAALLTGQSWSEEYELSLALHSGAAETAHFNAAWTQLNEHVEILKSCGRTVFDQLVGWEVQIDSCIARKDYAGSIAVAIEALRLLDTELPATPDEAEVGIAVQQAMESLAKVGPDGLKGMTEADDLYVVAGMRIMSSISSAAYFAAPSLLVVLACRLVVASVTHGLSSVTAYALSVYGIVLNTLGLHDDAQTWGEVSLELLERFDDVRIDARSRHVLNNFVCVWTVPLPGTLANSRAVIDRCKAIGDVEYAGYATHGYVCNAVYACENLQSLYEEAIELGDYMRRHQHFSAMHVHEPFEQLLRCYQGLTDAPGCLDGNGFSEQEALAMAHESGSVAGVTVINMLMGIARYTFGNVAEAYEHLAAARSMLEAVPSNWHIPITHQYTALAIFGLPSEQRQAHMAEAEECIVAMRQFAKHGPDNFAHRVALLEAEKARVCGDRSRAVEHFARAASMAQAGGWLTDLAVAHELAARCTEGDASGGHLDSARAAWKRWGAIAKF